MKTSKKLFLSFFCAACLLIAIFIALRTQTLPTSFAAFDAVKIDYRFFDQQIELEKIDNHWRVIRFNGATVADSRSRASRVQHLLDLFHGLTPEKAAQVAGSAANLMKLGFPQPPSLAIKLESSNKTALQMNFGPSAGRKILVYFPLSKDFAFLNGSFLRFLQETPAQDLRDRSVFTFELDDVEDFKSSGDCSAIKASRDGDRWTNNSALSSKATEAMLTEILATQYRSEDSATPPAQAPLKNCLITLTGRRGRTESLHIIMDVQGTLRAKNSALPSNYVLPPEFWTRLKSR